jgi:ABC transporter./Oligopeptide/dipeptide transporter, C-terminal region.
MDCLLEGKDLIKEYESKTDWFKRQGSKIRALDHVNIRILENETVGLVGESGSGKSTLAEVIGDLRRPDQGTVLYRGKNIRQLSRKEYREFRKNVQYIFQSARDSLNPYFPIREILLDPMKVLLDDFDEQSAMVSIKEMLERVKLGNEILGKHAAELSGGQAQRVAIARALLLRPDIIICDEPVSALDVTVQKQILDLLLELQQDFHISYLFITHDIGVVDYVANRIVVIRNGSVVEEGEKNRVLRQPAHDYTKKLIESSFLFR